MEIAGAFSARDAERCVGGLDELAEKIADHETREESLMQPFRRHAPTRR